MSKRIPTKSEPDCTGIGRWFLWVIVAMVLGALAVTAFKAKGQGLLGAGALVVAGAQAIPTLLPQGPGTTSAPPVLPGDCSGDTTPPIDVSDGYVVSTTGVTAAAGTVANPLGLLKVLDGTDSTINGAPANRRKVYLRGGTYTGRFSVNLTGLSGNPWIFMPYPGERPVLNQNSTQNAVGVTTYHINFLSPSAFLTFRGIEFTDKDYVPNNTLGSGHDDSEDAQGGLNGYHGGIKVDDANDIVFENCVIHDQSGSGLLTGSTDSRNITIRGCLLYNIGVPGRNKHHGLYMFNRFYTFPSRHVIDGNIFIHCVAWPVQAYSSSYPVSGIYFTNNIFRDSGGTKGAVTLWDDRPVGNYSTDVRFVNNSLSWLTSTHFFNFQNIITTGIINSNYFQMRAGNFLLRSNYTGVTVKSNVFVGSSATAIIASPTFASWATMNPAFDWNTYKFSDANPFSVNGGDNSFATWQSTTGDDANSTISTSTTTGLEIRYYPNQLDTNLVYFAIFNQASLASVDIDLTPFWPSACGTYSIKNAGNHQAAAVSSGAWTGQTAIAIAMNTQTYANPAHGLGPSWTESTTFFAGVARRIRANATAAETLFP